MKKFANNKIALCFTGMIVLMLTQVAPRLIIYAVIITLVINFVKIMTSIINEM